jgi:hypothetical protein
MEYFAACYISRQCKDAKELVDRIWEIASAGGQGSIVAQLAVQQFYLKAEGGFEECINEFLKRRKNVSVMRFFIDTVRYTDFRRFDSISREPYRPNWRRSFAVSRRRCNDITEINPARARGQSVACTRGTHWQALAGRRI